MEAAEVIDKIISYSAQGFTQERVAEMVGCSPQYVSKIQASEEYSVLLKAEAARLEALKRDEKQEKKYEDLEDKIVRQVVETLPFAEFRDLSRTMEVLIRRKQQQSLHSAGIVINGNAQINTVVLSIPQAAIPEITLNSQREVIAIGDQTLAPMQASQVRKLFGEIEEKQRTQRLVLDQEQENFLTSRGRDRRGEYAHYKAKRAGNPNLEEVEFSAQHPTQPGGLSSPPEDF